MKMLSLNIDGYNLNAKEKTITIRKDNNEWFSTCEVAHYHELKKFSEKKSEFVFKIRKEDDNKLSLIFSLTVFNEYLENIIVLKLIKSNKGNNLLIILNENQKLMKESELPLEILSKELQNKKIEYENLKEDYDRKIRCNQILIQQLEQIEIEEHYYNKVNTIWINKKLLLNDKLKIEKYQKDISEKEEKCEELKKNMSELSGKNKKTLREFNQIFSNKKKLSENNLMKIINEQKFYKFPNYLIDLNIFTVTNIKNILLQIDEIDFENFVSNIINNIDYKILGATILHVCCCWCDKPNFIKILMNKGADINLKSENYDVSKYPWLISVNHKNLNTLKFLLQNNADFTLKDNYIEVINDNKYINDTRYNSKEIYQELYNNAVRNNKLSILKKDVDKFKNIEFKQMINQ
jgi:hypothetical protein